MSFFTSRDCFESAATNTSDAAMRNRMDMRNRKLTGVSKPSADDSHATASGKIAAITPSTPSTTHTIEYFSRKRSRRTMTST